MTHQHLGLNLPGSNSHTTPSSSTSQSNQTATANRSLQPPNLPSPPPTQRPGTTSTRSNVPPTDNPAPTGSSTNQAPQAGPSAQSGHSSNTPAGSSNPVAHQPAHNAPTGTATPAAGPMANLPDPAAQRRTTERAALRARLMELEAEEANGAHPPANAPLIRIPALFADPAAVDKAREAAAAMHNEPKKPVLPELVPGFKANPLDASEFPLVLFHLSQYIVVRLIGAKSLSWPCASLLESALIHIICFVFPHIVESFTAHMYLCIAVIPPKVEDALRQYKYVPYLAITPAARLHAARNGDEAFSFNTQGNIVAKGLDRSRERTIKFHDWLTASRAVEERITFYHGANRGAAFVSHHKIVSELTSSHGWEIAQEYDIAQRELAAQNPAHNLTGLDTNALTLVATQAAARVALATQSLPHHTSTSPLKRSAPGDHSFGASQSPRKKARVHCFRCGHSGHLPGDCSAETTSAGKTVAPITATAKSRHALTAANGKHYCFNWARSSSCSFGTNCTNVHGCSICGESSHGAGSCPQRA